MNREFTELGINKIAVKPRLFKRDRGDLGTLEESIRKLGVLHPITVDRNNVLVAGKRRLDAARNVGLDRVPVLRLDIEAETMAALDIRSDENLCRHRPSVEELEQVIRMKKAVISAESNKRDAGVLPTFKRIFAHG